MIIGFNKSAEAKATALENLKSYLLGLSDEEQRTLLREAGIQNADYVMTQLDKKELAEQDGIGILKAFNSGLSNIGLITKINETAGKISSGLQRNMSGRLSFSIDGSHKSGLDYVPYDNYIAQLHKGERVLTADENKKLNSLSRLSKINSIDFKNISGKATSTVNNISLQINPQKATDAELDRIFNYVDRRYGTRY